MLYSLCRDQIRRLEKAIDELIKIQDDGKGTATIQNIIDILNHEITTRYNA